MGQDWKEMLAGLAKNAAPAEETNELPEQENCVEAADVKKQKETLRVVIDKKGRKGKVATIIEGFEIDDDEVARIASELKRKIGTGGSSRGGEILLQGDWKEKTVKLLKEMGYAAR